MNIVIRKLLGVDQVWGVIIGIILQMVKAQRSGKPGKQKLDQVIDWVEDEALEFVPLKNSIGAIVIAVKDAITAVKNVYNLIVLALGK